MSSKPRPQKPFRFVDLPAELRDVIYEMALTDQGNIFIVGGTRVFRRIARRCQSPKEYPNSRDGHFRRFNHDPCAGMRQHDRVALSPNLLAVSHQIHNEATGYLYNQPIVVLNTRTLYDFLAPMSDDILKRLRDVAITSWGVGKGAHKSANYYAMHALRGAINLRSLHLAGPPEDVFESEALARRIYRECFHFLQAFGRANGSISAAVEVIHLHDANFDSRQFPMEAPEAINQSSRSGKKPRTIQTRIGQTVERLVSRRAFNGSERG